MTLVKVLYKIRYFSLLPLVLLMIFVFSKALAGYIVDSAFEYEREWVAVGGIDKKQDWDDAVASIHLGMKIDPFNPNYPELLGRLHFWRFFVQDAPIESFDEAQSVVNAGLEPLRKSIEMRPTWPMAWASLLQLKSIGDQIDYEFEQVWNKSMELGDWESGVQTVLLEAGLIHWPRFNGVLRNNTINIFVAMTSKPYSELRAIGVVDRLGAWPLVCDVLVDPVLTVGRMRQACAELKRSAP
jgi:hypothetical protein